MTDVGDSAMYRGSYNCSGKLGVYTPLSRHEISPYHDQRHWKIDSNQGISQDYSIGVKDPAGVCIIITPNKLVNWNAGNLHIAVNLNGNATYDNKIDQARIHGG